MTITMLCGGVGGARAALALSENLAPESLTFVVNTGDDFSYLGLEIWPDWDTVVYTLSGLIDGSRGWGRADEGTRAKQEWARLGAPDWFHLGDRDLALHVYRSWALGEGQARDAVAAHIASHMEIAARVLRLTEQSLATEFTLSDGSQMDFQTWFVRHQGKPQVAAVKTTGDSAVTPDVLEAISDCDLLLIAPSNPFLSIHPMLGVPEVGQRVKARSGPTWAVSPLLAGKAVKGPLDTLIAQLSSSAGQQAIVDSYSGWAQRLLLPADEHAGIEPKDLALVECRTRLGQPEQRAEFVSDLMAAWTAHS